MQLRRQNKATSKTGGVDGHALPFSRREAARRIGLSGNSSPKTAPAISPPTPSLAGPESYPHEWARRGGVAPLTVTVATGGSESLMSWSSVDGPWADFRERLRDASAHRSWTIDANDGIIATAGLLLGFAGAGASNRLLLFTAAAASIAGGLSVGGASWAEQAAERDAQLLYAQRETADLAADPQGEFDELVQHWEQRGLTPDTAREVARQLSAHDALAAQLEWEYNFAKPVPASFPIWVGVGAGLAYVLGALVPLLITYFAPVDVEPWAILMAVTVTLVLSSMISSRTGELMPRRMLARTLVVGVLTMATSYAAGELLL